MLIEWLIHLVGFVSYGQHTIASITYLQHHELKVRGFDRTELRAFCFPAVHS